MDRLFYIFRHGETDWNVIRRCQGHTDIPLNQSGLRQVEELAIKMQSLPLDVIFSSDLSRAAHTGNRVAEALRIPIHFDPRLREMSYGEAEGLIYQDAILKYGDEIWMKLSSFKREFDDVGFPGGETRKEARDRFMSLLEEVVQKTNHQHIGISTHGGAIRNILHFFLDENHPMIPIPNCVVYCLKYDSTLKKFKAEPIPLF